MGEGIIDATITRWLVKVGDSITVDQSLVEIATDKVDSEIPSPFTGTVKELLFKEGDMPRVGQVIAILEVENEAGLEQLAQKTRIPSQVDTTNKTEDKSVTNLIGTKENKTVENQDLNHSLGIDDNTIVPFLSPLVKSIVKQEGITPYELSQVKGTGLNGRITRDDILSYIEQRSKFTEKPKPIAHIGSEVPSSSPLVEVVQMDRMRKLIADHMVMSKQTSAHVTSFIEADVTNLVSWRNREKDAFQKREGEKLTFTPMFVEATAKALKKYPIINSSIEGDKILLKKNINIGIATALPNGNLIVPVIKDADKLNLSGLAAKVNDLALRARENRLKPEEIQGGTFTITNLGTFETLTGTPIINQPQVAILAIGAITKRVAVIESSAGDSIAIRQMCMLSISYDHRVVDGAIAGLFIKEVRNELQSV